MAGARKSVDAPPVAADPSGALGRYIVAFSDPDRVSKSTVAQLGGTDMRTLSQVGVIIAELTDKEADALEREPGVTVSPDAEIHAYSDGDVARKPGAGQFDANTHKQASSPAGIDAQRAAESWGIDRVDQRSAVLNSSYDPPRGLTGEGVHVYVLDTGIAMSHPEFAGRIAASYDFVNDGNGVNDCHGHGTHVAGIIGSTRYGMAPKVTLHGVRVLNCNGSGYQSDFVRALDYVARVAPAASVANSSLGGGYNAAVNVAVANFVATGTPLVVAAGNDAANVSRYSPASAIDAVTVAATERGDTEPLYSNFGQGVDLYAPGSNIMSTDAFDPFLGIAKSGTSMASPHVAGYLALYFQTAATQPVATAVSALISQSTKGAVIGAWSANNLLYVNALPAPPPPPAPSVQVSAKAVSSASKLYVNVNPNLSGSRYWRFKVQKRNSAGVWKKYNSYNTHGKGETRTLNLKKGWYRAAVYDKYGYKGATSVAVYLRK